MYKFALVILKLINTSNLVSSLVSCSVAWQRYFVVVIFDQPDAPQTPFFYLRPLSHYPVHREGGTAKPNMSDLYLYK